MTSSRAIIFLIFAAVAAFAIWFGLLRPEQEPQTNAPAPTSATQTQQPAATPTEPTAEPQTPTAEPQTPTADTANDDATAADSPAQPQVDMSNWICTAWTDAAGNIVTAGTPNNETCTQWSVKRGAVSE